MSLPLIVLRPEPGLSETLAAARWMGLEAIAAPLFRIEPVAWAAPDPALYDAVLAGSANAFRCGGKELAKLATLPVHAVGEQTAGAARGLGFEVATTGSGGLQGVLDGLVSPSRLLRLAGEQRVPLRAPPGTTIDERLVYRALPLELSGEAAEVLRAGAVAVLHSAEAARHFVAECDRLALKRGHIGVATLGARIAAAAGPGWRVVATAERPTDDRLLELARRMCQ